MTSPGQRVLRGRRRRIVATHAAVSCVSVMAVTPASAVDWTISGFFSQSLEADSNVSFEDDGDAGLATTLDAGLAVQARTKTTTWLFAPGLRGTYTTDSDADLNAIRPRFNGSIAHQNQRGGVNGSVSIIPRFTNDTGFDDTEVTDETLLQINTNGSLSGFYSLDRRNTVSGGVFVGWRTFVDDPQDEDLGDTLRYGVNASFSRALDARTSANVGASATRFESDAGDAEDRMAYALTLGATRAVTPRLSLSGNGGASFNEDDGSLEPSFVGGLGLDYAGRVDSISLGLTQSVDQNSFGEIESRISLTGGYRHAINERSQWSVSARVTDQNPLFDESSDERRTFSVAPSYSYAIARDVDLSVGARFRLIDDEDGERASTSVFVRISKGISVLP